MTAYSIWDHVKLNPLCSVLHGKRCRKRTIYCKNQSAVKSRIEILMRLTSLKHTGAAACPSKSICCLCGACRPAEVCRPRYSRALKAGTDEKGADAGVFWVKGCAAKRILAV